MSIVHLSKENINYLFSVLEKQIDVYGRYHYKGVEKDIVQSRFLKEELGDMTYHIGILLQFLAFSYYNDDFKEKSKYIIDILLNKYLDIVSINGLIGREFLLKEEYETILLPHQYHCNKGTFFGLDSGICNKWFLKDNFYIRYDSSLDTISSILSGLYFISKIDEFKEEVYNIVLNLKKYYEANNYFVVDINNNKPCRFGNHHPVIMPMGYLIYQLINIILRKKIRRNYFMELILNNIRTYWTGIFKNKKERFSYNGYMFMMIFNAIQDAILNINPKIRKRLNYENIDYRNGMQKILYEAKGEENIFYYKISKKYNLEYSLGRIHIDLNDCISKGISIEKESDFVVPLPYRIEINRWEKSAYKIHYELKGSNIVYCNEDLLQANFMN
jgi:hypothetical protein